MTGGPIIRPRGRPSRFTSPDADEHGASTGDSSVTRETDASIARRTSSWNQWFLDAVASRNVDAVDLLLDMPWASTASIVSAMRAMHDPFVFERVCERLATRRAHELETKERVGGLTALGFAAKKGNAKALARLLDAGADADAADNAGATALMHAVMGDSLVAVQVLTERGACVDGRASVRPSDDRDDLATVDSLKQSKKKKKKGGLDPAHLGFAQGSGEHRGGSSGGERGSERHGRRFRVADPADPRRDGRARRRGGHARESRRGPPRPPPRAIRRDDARGVSAPAKRRAARGGGASRESLIPGEMTWSREGIDGSVLRSRIEVSLLQNGCSSS